MTPDALIVAPLVFWVLSVELWARARCQIAQHESSISPHSECKRNPSDPLRFATHVSGIAIAFILATAAVGMPIGVIVGLSSALAIFRVALAQLEDAETRRSYVTRYIQKLEKPKTQSASFGLYFSEPRLPTPYQVTMWLDPLLALNEPFVVLLNERKHMKHFPPSDQYEVVVVEDMPSQMSFLPRNIVALFYVNNSMTNLPVIATHPQVTHVQLLHGDSDKPPSYNPMSAVYDQLFVAGEMAIERYARHGVSIERDKFRIVGRPQIDLAGDTLSSGDDCAYSTKRKTIVYMTTWSGMFADSNFSSFSQAPEIIKKILEVSASVDLIFKPHPMSVNSPKWAEIERRIAQLNDKIPHDIALRIASPDEDPVALFARADLLISDVSSVVIDFLASGKPYIVTNPNAKSATDLEAFPSIAGGYLAAPDASDITALIEKCLYQDPLKEKRHKLREFAFGDIGRPKGEAFAEACKELLASKTYA